MLSPDKPIDSKQNDLLGRGTFAENLAKAIKGYSDAESASLTLGLYGKWGSGKTSVINMLRENFRDDNNVIVFNFQPWLFSDTKQLVSSFFKEFSIAIKHKDMAKQVDKIGDELETYASFFEPISLIPEPTSFVLSKVSSAVFGSVGKAAKKWAKLKKKTQAEIKLSIEKHLKSLDKKILVIIDDIDRLTSEEIRQIFQMVKALGDFPNTVYLLAMDKDVVCQALEDVQKGKGDEYLEKIVQVPFVLPAISKSSLHKMLTTKLDEVIAGVDEQEFDSQYWGNIYHSGFWYFFENVRDVVRYINVFRFNYGLLSEEVNIVDLIAITGIQVFEPSIFDKMKYQKDIFTGSVKESRYGGDVEKENIKNVINELASNLSRLKEDRFQKLLLELFPKLSSVHSNVWHTGSEGVCRRKLKVCSKDCYDNYFRMSLDDEEISNADMKKYVNSAQNLDLFKQSIIELLGKNKAIRFLNRFEDFIDNSVDEEIVKNVVQILFEYGDFFPENKNSMLSLPTSWLIGSLIFRLLKSIESKDIRFEIIKNAIDNLQDGFYIMCFEVSSYMQEHGEYEQHDVKADEERTISKEHLEELKNIFKQKLISYSGKKNIFKHKESLSILFLWLRLDRDFVVDYIQKQIQSDDRLLDFMGIFAYESYVHSSGDYTERRITQYRFKDINHFIEPSIIMARLNGIVGQEYTDEVKFAIDSFVKYFNGQTDDE